MTKAADALADAVETILVDCYNEDEQYTSFLTVLDDQVRLLSTTRCACRHRQRCSVHL